jgi:hypothetical protein
MVGWCESVAVVRQAEDDDLRVRSWSPWCTGASRQGVVCWLSLLASRVTAVSSELTLTWMALPHGIRWRSVSPPATTPDILGTAIPGTGAMSCLQTVGMLLRMARNASAPSSAHQQPLPVLQVQEPYWTGRFG